MGSAQGDELTGSKPAVGADEDEGPIPLVDRVRQCRDLVGANEEFINIANEWVVALEGCRTGLIYGIGFTTYATISGGPGAGAVAAGISCVGFAAVASANPNPAGSNLPGPG